MTQQARPSVYETSKTAQEVASALAEVRDGSFVGIDVVEKARKTEGFSSEAKQLLLRAIFREEPKDFNQGVSSFVHTGRDQDPNETILCENPESEKYAVTLGVPAERHLKPAHIANLT